MRAAEPGRPPWWWPALVYLGFGAVLLLGSILLWWRVWISGDPSSTISCQCGDPGQYLWLIRWVPWSILHGHNPFLSQAIYAGQGGSNTLELSDLLPGLVAAPITLLFGPVAAFNVLVTLVPVVNGLCLLFFLRRITTFLPGQLVAALLYAFLPYVVHDDPFGHFNIDLLFFPPLALWCVYELLASGRHRPVPLGAGLAGLVVAQFFTGPELLAMALVLGAVGIVLVVALAPRLVAAALRRLALGAAAAVAVAGAVLAYPLWFVLAGPRHVVGYPWPTTPFTGATLSGILHTGGSGPTVYNQVGGYFGNLPDSDALGLFVLVVLAVTSPFWYRRRLSWCAVVLGTVAWSFSLGVIKGQGGGPWAPWRIFYRLPVVSQITPSRFAAFSDLAVVILLAVALDSCWAWRSAIAGVLGARLRKFGPGSTDRTSARIGLGWGALCCLAALAALGPIAVSYLREGPFAVHDNPVPPWFLRAAPALRAGTILLAMPYPSSGAAQAMAWQADADFSFAMVGGRAQVPGQDGVHSIHDDPLAGSELLLDNLSWGVVPEMPVTPSREETLRADLRRWGVEVVVVTQQTRSPWYAVAFLTATLGAAPRWEDSAWVWSRLGDAPPLRISEGALRRCKHSGRRDPVGVARCVLRSAAI